jgi:hypothetical protein
MISGDADDSGESSTPTSVSTMSVAPLLAGAGMAHSGAASSDGPVVVRCEAICSDGAIIVLAWAKTSWAGGLRDEAA